MKVLFQLKSLIGNDVGCNISTDANVIAHYIPRALSWFGQEIYGQFRLSSFFFRPWFGQVMYGQFRPSSFVLRPSSWFGQEIHGHLCPSSFVLVWTGET